MNRSVLLLCAVLFVALQAIAQDPSPQSSNSSIDLYANTFDNRVYTNPALGLTVTFPEEWTLADTEFLRQRDGEAAKRSHEALIARLGPDRADFVNSGLAKIAEIANLVVARKPSGSDISSAILKTKMGMFCFAGPKGYFTMNDSFMSKDIKFLKSPKDVTVNGVELSQADLRINQSGGKPIFARIDVALLQSPDGRDCRYVVFDFVENSIEEAQRDSEMLKTLKISAPKPEMFPAPKGSEQQQ